MTTISRWWWCAPSTTPISKQKLKKRTQTSGCAQGTAFGDLLEAVESVALPKAELRTSWLYQMTQTINTMPSLYLEAGAIHGCVLCREGSRSATPRTSAATTPSTRSRAGCTATASMPADKILYTTGRLTSEMVIKTVRMGIPILVSRSGFTAWGVDLARQVGLTLVGRARGKRFIALAGEERIVYDQNLAYVEEESARHKRKGEAVTTEIPRRPACCSPAAWRGAWAAATSRCARSAAAPSWSASSRG